MAADGIWKPISRAGLLLVAGAARGLEWVLMSHRRHAHLMKDNNGKEKIQQFEFGLGFNRQACVDCDDSAPGLYYMSPRECGGLMCDKCFLLHASTCRTCAVTWNLFNRTDKIKAPVAPKLPDHARERLQKAVKAMKGKHPKPAKPYNERVERMNRRSTQ